MSCKYEGVLKVVRRSRATLLFSVGVLMVKPQGVPENRFPPVRQTIPGATLIFSMGVPLVKPQAGPGERVSSC